jgi:hypothetical protein
MTTTQQAPPTDLVGQALAQMIEGFTDLVDAPVWSLEESALEQRFAQATAVKAAAEEMMARLAAEMDDRRVPGRLGARSLFTHLLGGHRMSAAEARRVTSATRQLHDNGTRSALTAPVRAAQARGEITADQAVVIATAINRVGHDQSFDAVQAAQADLISYAGELPLADLQRLANHVVEVIDPEGADRHLEARLRATEQAQYGAVELTIQVKPDGSSSGRWHNLTALHTAMLKKAVDALATPRRDHLTHDADHPLGSPIDRRVETSLKDLPYPNRLGRAFAELIEHLPVDALPAHGSANATVVVTLDEVKLRQACGEALLDSGASISASEARRLACNADILPMVLSGDSKVLDLGRAQRLFDRHQRLALAQRDGGCVFWRCDRTPSLCEAHHVAWWSNGGPTNISNGVLLCSFHHHLIHQGEWQVAIAADGIPEAIPPPWVDPRRKPIRHSRFRPRAG